MLVWNKQSGPGNHYAFIHELILFHCGKGVSIEMCIRDRPDRREANFAGGKSPEQFNYISVRGTVILEKRLRALMLSLIHIFS